jgi:hypothetical protein
MQAITLYTGGRNISISRERDGRTTITVAWGVEKNSRDFEISLPDLPKAPSELLLLRAVLPESFQVSPAGDGMILIESFTSQPPSSRNTESPSSSPKDEASHRP